MGEIRVGHRRSWAGRRLATAAGVAVVLVGCGSGSSGGGAGGGSHSSPEGAVRGFVSALTNWDGTTAGLNAVADWVAPSQRTAFTSGFSALTSAGGSVKISFKVDNFGVSSVDSTGSDHATVHVSGTGSYCFSGGVAGVSTSFCTTASLTPAGTKDTVDTVNVGGQWYVDTGSGGTSTSTSVTGSPTSTDTGSASSSGTDTGTSATSSSTDTGTGSATVGTDTGSSTATTTGTDTSSSST